jgi:putative endonuclease
MASELDKGKEAENIAAAYLRSQGLEISARNVRCRAGEIDLVCRDGAVIVVVEVRQRGARQFGGALASVTWRKRRKIIRTVRFLLRTSPDWRERRIRFDVLGIEGEPHGVHDLIWVKDAFRAT